MRPTDFPPRWRVSGDSVIAPLGPAMTTLRSVVARLASLVRCAGVAYIAVQVAVWHSFYLAVPWRLAGPVAASVWAAAVTVYLRRRWPAPLFACLDSAVYVALALSCQGCVPPSLRGHAYSWLVIAMSGQLIVPAWYAPAAVFVPLALAAPAAYWAGAVQAAGAVSRTTTVAMILLAMVAGVHIYGRRALSGRAAAADAALAEADRAASEQYVILSRNIERREHERLLHDTVLNTLTALARAGPGDAAGVVSRCRRDVALIEAALNDPDDADGATGPSRGDMAGRVRAVAAEMHARGLTVHVAIDGGPGSASPGSASPASAVPAPAVPASVAAAISNAVREALSNVVAHAGTGEAWVEVSLPAPGRLQVTVRDRGAGFDPADVDRTRLGLRRSIAERMADCGGQASIWSAPGQGTVVSLSWPPSPGLGPARPELALPLSRALSRGNPSW
jgi:signal transduction histidine kinase